MWTGNTPDRAICCTAQAATSARGFRGHPLAFHAITLGEAGGQNRGAMLHVLPHAHNSPLRHSGLSAFFLGCGHSGDR